MQRNTVDQVKYVYPYEVIQETVDFLFERTSIRPRLGIILGSGLGNLVDVLTDKSSFPYEMIPNFPKSTAPGHSGHLIFGFLENIPVVCMKGRIHYYEGYDIVKCALPVRVMKLAGVTHLIVTNAAGGLNDDYKAGDIMIIKDHINLLGLSGVNPLVGPNDDRLGVRFPAMSQAYDENLRTVAKTVADQMGILIHEGVYACVGGPNFETIAEARMIKLLGIDAVGMSTIPEVIIAKHCGLKVFAFSLIANKVVDDYNSLEETSEEEVLQTVEQKQQTLKTFVTNIVKNIVL